MSKSPDNDEPLDPLADFSARERGSILKPILMIIVVVLLGTLLNDYKEELVYYFESEEPIDIGEVDDYPTLREENPDFKAPIKHNSYVRLRGIPLQRSQSAKNIFFKLAGDDIFVETYRENRDEIQELTKDKSAGETLQTIDRSYYEGSGRILSFAKLGGRYNGIRRYYGKNYGDTFCETLTPEKRLLKEERKRDAIKAQWKEEYAAMSEAERSKSHMKPTPSPETVKKLMNAEPICVNAYLVQDGKKPKDYIWYLLFAIGIAAFMMFNIVLTIRWFIRFFRA